MVAFEDRFVSEKNVTDGRQWNIDLGASVVGIVWKGLVPESTNVPKTGGDWRSV